MANWNQAPPVPGRSRRQRVRPTATLALKLLALGTLLLCSLSAHGQVSGPLVINPIGDTNVMPGTTITIITSVTNTDVSVNELLWSLANPPSGASITNGSTPTTGLFTWTPSASQAPSTNTINVQVQDRFNLTNHTSASFRVNVFTNTAPTPPFLAPINDVTIVAGQSFTNTNSAHTTDGTTNALLWSLEPGAPDGASIGTNTGIFSWKPTAQQADNYTIGVTVTEQSSPPLSSTEEFNINVILTNNCSGFDDFVAAVEQGGVVPLPDCPTIVLSNTLIIANDVTLDAGSAKVLITGNNLIRLFTVLAPATLTLNHLTLSGGMSTNGGAIYVQQGAVALLSNCIFSGNSAVGSNGVAGAKGADTSGTGGNGTSGTGGGAAEGGAIYNAGALTLSACQFLTNQATGGTGGAGGNGGNGRYQGGNGGNGGSGGHARGGAVFNIGTNNVTIDSCTFTGNSAASGSGASGGTDGTGGTRSGLPGIGGAAGVTSGAGVCSTGDITLTSCTFSQNSATGGDSAAGGTQVNGNGSNGPRGGDGLGGGVFGAAIGAVTNCTFFGNSVTGGKGGNGGAGNYNAGNGGNGGNGLGGAFYGSAGTNYIVNCTIAQNQAVGGTNGVAGTGPFRGTDGSPGLARGAGVYRAAGTFILKNTILVTNAPGTNAYGTITDAGNNLSSDASLAGSSRKNVDPRTSPLSGDPPQTMALLHDSPAVDAADDLAAPDVDERGTRRPVGPHSDIGAYEYPTQLAPAIISPPSSQTVMVGSNATFVVSATGDPPLAYRWQFKGTNIAGATRTTFTVTNAQPTNAGDYTVSVSNHVSVVVSPAATLTVCVPVTISGHVMDGTNGLSGVTVTAGANSALTDTNGAYTISGICPGDYFVFASLSGYEFSPAQEVITPPGASNVNFTVKQPVYTISGRVVAGTNGVSGVRIFGGQTTDANGYFTLSLPAGTNTLTPLKPGFNYTFQPPNRIVVVPPSATNQDFIAGWRIASLVRLADGTIQFQVIGTGTIRVEASSNLVNWVTLSNHVAPYTFIDHTAGSVPQRFYRAAQP